VPDRVPHTDPELRSVLRLLLRDAEPARVLKALASEMAAIKEPELAVRAVKDCAAFLTALRRQG
jgi:hypothetical protein